MSLPFDLPVWMLWTAAGLIGCAVLGLVGGSRRGRRKPASFAAITFEPLTLSSARIAVAPGRPARAPAFAPPAPLADAPLGAEQRSHFRRPGNPVLVLLADADQQRNPWNAWVVDRSRHGLRLAVERPLKVGGVYTVRPTHAPPATPWSALEVRHCTEMNGHWEAGCRFLTPPPVAVLMLYG
ncbi:MAG TPA: PilZ domain-containing protein [Gemmataceae bacterium]|nr:PilZ domain-containing protein [Gemmataceae bacterium]